MPKFLTLVALTFLVACGTSSPDLIAPSAPQLSIFTDSAPAAPTNFAIVVDSTTSRRAYLTATWTDHTGGRGRYQVFTQTPAGAPAIAAGSPTQGIEALSFITPLIDQDAYVRSSIFPNDVPGVSIFSAAVGPIHLTHLRKAAKT